MTRLKFYLTSHGIKANWLAEKSGISKQLMSLYCRGTRIPAEIAFTFGDILGVNPRDLIGDVEEEELAEKVA